MPVQTRITIGHLCCDMRGNFTHRQVEVPEPRVGVCRWGTLDCTDTQGTVGLSKTRREIHDHLSDVTFAHSYRCQLCVPNLSQDMTA